MRRCLAGRRTRLLVGIGAAVCFAVAAILLAASLAGVRLPGESATGSVSVSSAQLEQETLDRAAILGSEGRVAEAVQLYNQVLQKDPNQPDALVYGGWLVRLAGLASKNQLVVARGDASVARAVKIAPAYPDGHALFGVILYEDFGRPGAASVQFRDALEHASLQEPADVGRRDSGESLRGFEGAVAVPLRRCRQERRDAGPARLRLTQPVVVVPQAGSALPRRPERAQPLHHRPESCGKRLDIRVGRRPADREPERTVRVDLHRSEDRRGLD